MLTHCVCVFQVRGTPGAASRASGCTLVTPPFRRYQSHGYSTLRHTCSSTRNCCNVTSKSIFFLLYCFFFLFVQACIAPHPVSVSKWNGKEKKKGKTSLYTHLSYVRGMTVLHTNYLFPVLKILPFEQQQQKRGWWKRA